MCVCFSLLYCFTYQNCIGGGKKFTMLCTKVRDVLQKEIREYTLLT